MYRQFFGISVKPFSIAPDPTFLYMSEGHREALAHLRYGLEGDGAFILLTGEIGAGKTTVCRCLLEQVPADTDIAYIINPKVTARELLSTICDELGIAPPADNSIKALVDAINGHLLAAHAGGRRTILIIDEAQNLAPEVLEQIRLLTNLETNQRKLLQVILLGQPELRSRLARDDLRQLCQRISARHHLGPLDKRETTAYVHHRLAVAGLPPETFSPRAVRRLHRLSGGIPRLINIIADRALLGAYAKGVKRIDKGLMEQAGREVLGGGPEEGLTILPRRLIVLVTALVCVLILAVINAPDLLRSRNTPAAAKMPAPAAAPPPSVASTTPPPPKTAPQARPWPEDLPPLSEEAALRALLALWGVKHPPDDTTWPCRAAEDAGLRCLFKKDGIGGLMRLNRPAVLDIGTAEGERFVLIYAVLGDVGKFAAGERRFTAPLSELAARWNGTFTAIWRPPPGYRDSIRPGDQGPAVAWLAERLAIIDGEEYNMDSRQAVYDDVLVGRVKRLQFAHDLPPDGIAGKDTITLINTLTHAGGPTLAGNNVPGGGQRPLK